MKFSIIVKIPGFRAFVPIGTGFRLGQKKYRCVELAEDKERTGCLLCAIKAGVDCQFLICKKQWRNDRKDVVFVAVQSAG
jgi:hypothetical protein